MHKVVDCCLTILVTLLLSLSALAQDDSDHRMKEIIRGDVSRPPKPKLSKDPMTAEEVAIYRAALKGIEDSSLEGYAADRTVPFDLSFGDRGCVEFLDLQLPSERVIHKIDPAALPGMLLVDGDFVEYQIVKQGVETSLFAFSEIVFDKRHRYAVLQYSLFCGWMCGNGNTLVLERFEGSWKIVRSWSCRGWVS